VLGVQATTENLHFGLAIYQVPALDRRPAKLENYPIVLADIKCISWSAKAYYFIFGSQPLLKRIRP
jgi:hypothetical protein